MNANVFEFNESLSELRINFGELYDEAKLAYADGLMDGEEFANYEKIYVEFETLISNYAVGEVSQNDLLRGLFNLTKDLEINAENVYHFSAFDLMSESYIELAEINLCR